MASKPEIVVLASGKRLHGLCSLPEWSPKLRLVGVWSPGRDEREAAAARYRVPSAESAARILGRFEEVLVLVGGLGSAEPAVAALGRGHRVCAWPPFCAADDPPALERLVAAAAAAGERWQVARPVFEPAGAHRNELFGEHLPAPPEALDRQRLTGGDATPLDVVAGRAAAALATWSRDLRRVAGAEPNARTTTTPTYLSLEVRIRDDDQPLPLRWSLGAGRSRALRLPGSAGAPNGGARSAPGWTRDSPRQLVETALRFATRPVTMESAEHGATTLAWLRALQEERSG